MTIHHLLERSHRFAVSIAICGLAFFMPVVSVAEELATQQPQPGAPGVVYATLGNNADNPGALITVDTTTGAGTMVGPTGIAGEFGDEGVPALAVSVNGDIFAMDIGSEANLYQLDAVSGAATLIAPTTLSFPSAIAFNGAGVLWAMDSNGDLYILNSMTGDSYLVGPSGVFIKGMTFDPLDGELWGSDASGSVYILDVHTGAATLVGNTGLPASPDICFDAAGVLYGSSGGGFGDNNLITIDKATGQGQVVGSIGHASVAGLATGLARVVPATVASFRSRWTESRVEVRWTLIDIEGIVSFQVARSDAGGRFEQLHDAEVTRERSEYTFNDHAVDPGKTYRYRVEILENGEMVAEFQTSITTPTLEISLAQNYPNPFNPITHIPFAVGTSARVSLLVHDASGRHVRTLVDRAMRPGNFVELWDGRDEAGSAVATGVYFYKLRVGNLSLTRKAVLLK